MNLYKVKPKMVVDAPMHQAWRLGDFYIVANDLLAAAMLAQTEGIRLMHLENAKIEAYNENVKSGKVTANPMMAMFGAGQENEVPPMPQFKVDSIKVVWENVAVDGFDG